MLERRYYGESAASPNATNLRGQLILVFDQAGQQKLGPFDFKGNLLATERTLAEVYDAAIDWSAIATETDPADAETTAAAALESETFVETRAYDALDRIVSLTTPDESELIPTYNEASLLEAVDVKLRGASTATTFVENIEYDAKGQRTLLELGNGTSTAYSYDPLTFRLTQLITTRASPSNTLQDLAYTYDPVGNITAVEDDAQQTVFFDNAVVSADQTCTYDALYRLVAATGREHKSIGDVQVDQNGAPLQTLPHANDSAAVRNYEETYEYDEVGNLLELFHDAGGGAATWTRTYSYGSGTPTNRLVSSSIPGGTATYTHDDHGNITVMPHLSGGIDYSPFDQMSHASNGTQDTYFTYGADGQRARKVYDTNANLIKERIYLGAFELYRERTSSGVQLERETLHVMDGVKRIAMVETKTIAGGSPVGTPVSLFRFQYTNHLGSAHLDCDEDGLVISYEELAPYGSSAYRSAPSGTEVSARRYRYTGKERDEETGFDYFGARYYAPWLGRWTTADPLGLQAGLNLYLYGRASPVVMVDPSGMKDEGFLEGIVGGFVRGASGGGGSSAEGPADISGEYSPLDVEATVNERIPPAPTESELRTQADARSKSLFGSKEAVTEFEIENLTRTTQGESVGIDDATLEGLQDFFALGALAAAAAAAGGAALGAAGAAGLGSVSAGAVAGAAEGSVFLGGSGLYLGLAPTPERIAVGIGGGALGGALAGKLGELAARMGAAKAAKSALKFDPSDLVYGPSARGRLRELQESAGGRLLQDVGTPSGGQSWADFSIQTLERHVGGGGRIRFDLTHVDDLPGALAGTGQHGKSVTAVELRHLKANWERLRGNVQFYKNRKETGAPW